MNPKKPNQPDPDERSKTQPSQRERESSPRPQADRQKGGQQRSEKRDQQRMDDDGGQTSRPGRSEESKSPAQRSGPGTKPDFGDQEPGDPRRTDTGDVPPPSLGEREGTSQGQQAE